MRNAIINAAEMASYDQMKTWVCKSYPSIKPESRSLHVVLGFIAGFIAVCCASPMDVIKTRIMNVIYYK